MSVAVDPRSRANHYVYLYYTFKKDGSCRRIGRPPGEPRLAVRARGDNDMIDPASEIVLIDNIPAPADYHNGADLAVRQGRQPLHQHRRRRLRLADAGQLPGPKRRRARPDVLLGKILRITRDGTSRRPTPSRAPAPPAATSPASTTAGNKCQETFAWGLRNPFRIASDPNVDGTRLFMNDVGEITWEEIDELGRRRRLRVERAGGLRARSARAPTAGRRRPG